MAKTTSPLWQNQPAAWTPLLLRARTGSVVEDPDSSRSSIDSTSQHPKLGLPEDLSYSLKRWLQRRPNEEPWSHKSSHHISGAINKNSSVKVSGSKLNDKAYSGHVEAMDSAGGVKIFSSFCGAFVVRHQVQHTTAVSFAPAFHERL